MNENTRRPFMPDTLLDWVLLIWLVLFNAGCISYAFVGARSPYEIHKDLARKLIKQERRIQKIEAANAARDADVEWMMEYIQGMKPLGGE